MSEPKNKLQYYRITDITRMLCLSKAGIYANIKAGVFPRQVKFGDRAARWRSDEVQAVCSARDAGKSTDEVRALVHQLHAARIAAVEGAAVQVA